VFALCWSTSKIVETERLFFELQSRSVCFTLTRWQPSIQSVAAHEAWRTEAKSGCVYTRTRRRQNAERLALAISY
jgi:hypothetical protein